MLRRTSILLMLAVTLGLLAALPASGKAVRHHRLRLTRSDATTRVLVRRGDPVEIAFAADLTGSTSSFAPSIRNAVTMAVEAHPSIRGFPLQLNVVDAPCGDTTADVAAATAIVANAQNVAVLGHFCSTGDTAALPIYQAAGLPTLSGSTTDPSLPPLGPDVFNSVAVPDACCPSVDQFSPWYAAVQDLPSDIAWRQAYTERFGAAPMSFADLYYDAAGLLIRAVQRTSSVTSGGSLVIDRAALAREIRSTSGYRGVTCTVTLNPATGYRVNDPDSLARCGDG